MKLGDRIKKYESTFYNRALSRMPLMIRVDGRAFHTFAKNAKLEKPFDGKFIGTMQFAALQLAKQMQGFKVAYVQSDEATFCLTDYDDIETQGWFDYELPKIISISAATMSVIFNNSYLFKSELPCKYLPVFDSRAFNVPISDVPNAFLWRAKDWSRNSLQMYCRSFFSHKQLHKKNRADMHEMLYEIGKNWTTDLDNVYKNGTFIINNGSELIIREDILPDFKSISSEIGHLFKKGVF